MYPFGGVSGAFYEFNNSLVVVAASLLVAAFTNLSIPVSTRINRLGALTYGAYLTHVFWIVVLSRFINPFAAAEAPVILSWPLCSSFAWLSARS